MRRDGYVARMGKMKIYRQFWSQYDSHTYIKEWYWNGCQVLDWLQLAEDRGQWRTSINI